MATFRQKFFAWILKKGDKLNDKLYRRIKAELLNDIHGTVVEIGPGTGINFLYLPRDINWIGIEPNESFHKTIMTAAGKAGIRASIITSSAEQIQLPDETADAVISTLVLCSVPSQQKILQEIKRILKPNGKLILIEHVAARRGSGKRRMQNLFNPINRMMADGCNCNRETWKELEQAGFSSVHIQHTNMKGTMALHSPHIFGYMVK